MAALGFVIFRVISWIALCGAKTLSTKSHEAHEETAVNSNDGYCGLHLGFFLNYYASKML